MDNPTQQDWANWQAHKSNKERWIEQQEEKMCANCDEEVMDDNELCNECMEEDDFNMKFGV